MLDRVSSTHGVMTCQNACISSSTVTTSSLMITCICAWMCNTALRSADHTDHSCSAHVR